MEVKTLLCRYTYRFFRYDIPNSKTDPTRVVPGTVFLFRIRRIRHVFLRCRARSYAHASPTLVCVSRFVEHSPFNIAPTLVSWLAANGMAWPCTVACQYLVVQKFIAACCVPGISGGGGLRQEPPGYVFVLGPSAHNQYNSPLSRAMAAGMYI